jgi:acetylornithine deacetylase/succinyl-diaminopimelate desuccinylase-like protein
VFFPAVEHDLTNPYLQAFASSIEKVTGVRNPDGVISLAVSEAVHFREHGIPCAVTYPVGGGHHSDDEWIEKASLLQFVPILRDYLEAVAVA